MSRETSPLHVLKARLAAAQPGIADMDPDEVLADVRREAAKFHQAVPDIGDLPEPARALAEQFRKLGRVAA